MSVQVKAFQWSFLIHTLLIGTVMALGSFFKGPPKLLVINFDLEPAQISEGPSAPKADPSRKRPTLRKESSLPKIRAVSKTSPPSRPIESAVKDPLPEPQPPVNPMPSAQAVPVFSPAARPQNATEDNPGLSGGNSLAGGGNVLAGGTGGGSGTGNLRGSSQGSGSGENQGQSKYLREHFSYIRDKILRNIRYPSMARRMGWQGRVLLSFIITLDGSIKEAKIMQGSGFEVLDKNAVETVKDTAPFPKPPAEARLVIPITYRLE